MLLIFVADYTYYLMMLVCVADYTYHLMMLLCVSDNTSPYVVRYVLLKEMNMLLTMKAEYDRLFESFPNAERLEKVWFYSFDNIINYSIYVCYIIGAIFNL